MREITNYIVQYVGFKTELASDKFIERWMPFATSFKKAGIRTIDLYDVQGSKLVTFVSRNVWDSITYFENFPSGIARSGSGAGVIVTQFGGFWLQPDQLARPEIMKLAFLTEKPEESSSTQIARLRCSDNLPYEQMLEISPIKETNFSMQLYCKHLRQI